MQATQETQFRLYAFINKMLSPLDKGLQVAHLTSRLTTAYNPSSEQGAMAYKWGSQDYVIVPLNGGNSRHLKDIGALLKQFETEGMNLPFSYFRESEDVLDGALTTIGIIVPQDVYAHPAMFEFNLNVDQLCDKYPGVPVWHLHLICLLRATPEVG